MIKHHDARRFDSLWHLVATPVQAINAFSKVDHLMCHQVIMYIYSSSTLANIYHHLPSDHARFSQFHRGSGVPCKLGKVQYLKPIRNYQGEVQDPQLLVAAFSCHRDSE